MNRVLLDQGLPSTTAAILREAGWDALHVGEIGLAKATDADILEWCRLRNAVCVTLDADFHALLAVSSATAPSVLRIRVEGLDAMALAQILAAAFEKVGEELKAGAVVSVTEARIRVRRLPIGRTERQ